jgi:ADP-dependent NAD(P)H-hydrate dehydratase / NAD(P)H-hydrate epimerase
MNGSNQILLSDTESTKLDQYSLDYSMLSDDAYMGMATASVFQKHHKKFKNYEILILCGSGNNGGDGLALSNLFYQEGFYVNVYKKTGNHSSTFIKYLNLALKSGISILNLEELHKHKFKLDKVLIVDCLLGTGITGKPLGLIQSAIGWINSQKKSFQNLKVLSIDTPSGYNIDEKDGFVETDILAEIGSKKISNLFSRLMIKKYSFHPIGFPLKNFQIDLNINNFISNNDKQKKSKNPNKRNNDSHKYKNGASIFIGGSKDMNGAIFLSCKAFHSFGGGISKIYTPSEKTQNFIGKSEKSFMITLYNGSIELDEFITKTDSIVIGPGLSTKDTPSNLQEILDLKKLTILDAGLIQNSKNYTLHEKVILTPHDGELIKLAERKFKNFYDKLTFIKDFCKMKNTNLLLKGPISIFTNTQGVSLFYFNPNPYLATMGTGDVYTGLLAALYSKYKSIETVVNLSYSFLDRSNFMGFYPSADEIIELLKGKNIDG